MLSFLGRLQKACNSYQPSLSESSLPVFLWFSCFTWCNFIIVGQGGTCHSFLMPTPWNGMDGCSSFISQITAQKRLFQMISSEISVSGYDAFTEGGGPLPSRERLHFPGLWALPCCAALGTLRVTWSLYAGLQCSWRAFCWDSWEPLKSRYTYLLLILFLMWIGLDFSHLGCYFLLVSPP